MISEEFIKELTTKYQTFDINVKREYFQHIFLSYFYQQSKAANIFFKGGTALRFLYHSPRFSEDLDFNSAFIDYKGIEDLLLDTLTQIERENISFNLKEAKQTTGGYLAEIIFVGFEQPIKVELEISLREAEKKGQMVSVANDFVPAYNITAVTETQLVFEKIRALLSRQKPRDFYDLYFILRKQLPIPQKKKMIPQVQKVLNQSKLNFGSDLKQFLPKNHWAIIRDFKSILARELNRFSRT